MSIDQQMPMRPSMLGATLLAGLAAGVAEILWVALYCAVTPLSMNEVARQIALSTYPALADSSVAPIAGMAIHLGLSVLLALFFVGLIRRFVAGSPHLLVIVFAAWATLASVWAMNFFLILPIVNPAFIGLMPYAVTFISKMLFGLTLATVFYRSSKQTKLHI